jgi:hypothetical protein
MRLRCVIVENCPAGKTGGLCTDWQRTVQDIQQATLESGGAPILFGLCSEHGANYIANATIFPHVHPAIAFNYLLERLILACSEYWCWRNFQPRLGRAQR